MARQRRFHLLRPAVEPSWNLSPVETFSCHALSVFEPTARPKSAEMAIEKKVRILVSAAVMLSR